MSKFQRRILVIEGLPGVRSVLRALLAATEEQIAQSAKVLAILRAAAAENLLIDLRSAEADSGTAPQKIKNASIGFVGRVVVLTAETNGSQAFKEVCELVRQHSLDLPAQHPACSPEVALPSFLRGS